MLMRLTRILGGRVVILCDGGNSWGKCLGSV